MPRSDSYMEVSVCRDILWIRDANNIYIGKFGSGRFEVYTPTLGRYVFCNEPIRGKESWRKFQRLIKEHHGIDVPDEKMPENADGLVYNAMTPYTQSGQLKDFM